MMYLDNYKMLIPVSAEDEKKLLPLYELFRNHKYPNVEIVYERCKWVEERRYIPTPMTDMERKKLGEEICRIWMENEKKYKTDGST